MTECVEQRYCINLLPEAWRQSSRNNSQNSSGPWWFLSSFNHDSAMSVNKSKSWHNRFKDGHTSVESNERYGRPPSTCHNDVIIEELKTSIMANRHLRVREIGDELGISKDSAHAILMQDLGMRRVSAKFVPRLLSEEQKQVCLDIAQDFVANYRWQSQIPEHCNNWRWKLGARVQPWNESSVFAVKTSIIAKTQKGTTSEIQDQGDADCHFWLPRNSAPRIYSRRTNHHKIVLPESSPASSWCNSSQETGFVAIAKF